MLCYVVVQLSSVRMTWTYRASSWRQTPAEARRWRASGTTAGRTAERECTCGRWRPAGAWWRIAGPRTERRDPRNILWISWPGDGRRSLVRQRLRDRNRDWDQHQTLETETETETKIETGIKLLRLRPSWDRDCNRQQTLKTKTKTEMETDTNSRKQTESKTLLSKPAWSGEFNISSNRGKRWKVMDTKMSR